MYIFYMFFAIFCLLGCAFMVSEVVRIVRAIKCRNAAPYYFGIIFGHCCGATTLFMITVFYLAQAKVF